MNNNGAAGGNTYNFNFNMRRPGTYNFNVWLNSNPGAPSGFQHAAHIQRMPQQQETLTFPVVPQGYVCPHEGYKINGICAGCCGKLILASHRQ